MDDDDVINLSSGENFWLFDNRQLAKKIDWWYKMYICSGFQKQMFAYSTFLNVLRKKWLNLSHFKIAIGKTFWSMLIWSNLCFIQLLSSISWTIIYVYLCWLALQLQQTFIYLFRWRRWRRTNRSSERNDQAEVRRLQTSSRTSRHSPPHPGDLSTPTSKWIQIIKLIRGNVSG